MIRQKGQRMNNHRIQKMSFLAVCLACCFLPAGARAMEDIPVSGTSAEGGTADLFRIPARDTQTGSFFMDDFCGSDFLSDSELPQLIIEHDPYKIIQPLWGTFQQELSDTLLGYDGDWSIYLKDLNTGRTMDINEHSMESASLIKLYIAGAVLEQIKDGKLEDTNSVSSMLDAMITVSDNESANSLVMLLRDKSGSFQSGLDVVNDFIRRNGFSSTQQVNGIANSDLWISDSINMTSAADCGHLLEMVYNGTFVSEEASSRLMKLLIRQAVDYKIPSALPSDVQIAHKTGEVSDTENDVSIIYTPYGDFVYCILSNALQDTDTAVAHIRDITQTVYHYFTGYVWTEDMGGEALEEYLGGRQYIIYENDGAGAE